MRWAAAIGAVAGSLLALPSQAAEQEFYGKATLPNGIDCSVYLTSYQGDPKNVRLTARMVLPSGRTAVGPANLPIGAWRNAMHPKGNMDLVRYVCGAFNDQLKKNGLLPG